MGCTCFRCTSFCRCLLGGALVSSAPSNYFAPLPLLVHHFLCWCTTSLAGAPLPLLVHYFPCWCTTCFAGAPLARLVHLRQVHPLSVPPFASAVQSVSVRRPIGFRSPSNRIPSAVQSDSVRRPIGFRSPSDQIPFAVGGKVLGKTLQERCAQRQYYRRLRHL